MAEQYGRIRGEHGEGIKDVSWISHLCRVFERGQHLRPPEPVALLGLCHLPPHGSSHSSGHIPHICQQHQSEKEQVQHIVHLPILGSASVHIFTSFPGKC